jgi:hypothetical protein
MSTKEQMYFSLSSNDGQIYNFFTYSHNDTLAGYLKKGWLVRFIEKTENNAYILLERDLI